MFSFRPNNSRRQRRAKEKPDNTKYFKLCRFCRKPKAGVDWICSSSDDHTVARWTNAVCSTCVLQRHVLDNEVTVKFLETGHRKLSGNNKNTLRGLVRRRIVKHILSWQSTGRYIENERKALLIEMEGLKQKRMEHEKVKAAKNERIKELMNKNSQSKITRGIMQTYYRHMQDEEKKIERVDLSLAARGKLALALQKKSRGFIDFSSTDTILIPRMKGEILSLLVPKVSRMFADKFLLKTWATVAPTPVAGGASERKETEAPAKSPEPAEHALSRVDFVGKKIDRADMDMLCWFLRARWTVSLRVMHAGLQSPMIRSLADELCVTPPSQTLHSLDLSFNLIDKEGAKMLAEVIRCNSVLKNINLAGNKIGPTGASAIADALRGEKASVTDLNLFMNGIDMLGASSLAEALAVNTTLKNLNIRSNNIYPEGATAIGEALLRNRTLEHLNVADNYIGRSGAQSIAANFRARMKELRLCFG